MLTRLFIISLVLLSLNACQSIRNAAATPVPNPGPCPNALSLYDAHRLVEIKGEETVFSNVGFTAEILNVTSTCRYSDQDLTPIDNEIEVALAFGRGPAAIGEHKTYQLFVAVTGLNRYVIEKQVFPIEITFQPGEDEIYTVERFDPILIPRANNDTSGANFEILVGFELTEDQLEFNQSGLRFRVNAGQE